MISWRCVVLLSISSCAAATVDATTAATRADKDALCYVDRYADLHRHFCVADTCDLQRARDHYRDHGAAEGRAYACGEAANASLVRWCASHAYLKYPARKARPRRAAPRSAKLPDGRSVTVATLFDYVDQDALAADDVLYRVAPSHSWWVHVLAVRIRDRVALAASNEFLSLLKGHFDPKTHGSYYGHIPPFYAGLAKTDLRAVTTINESAVPLITSFSPGTGHGFAGFWSILAAWCDRDAADPSKNQTLLVYDGSDRGMLEVVRAAAATGLVDGARLRYLRPGVTYRFRRLEVIPNPEHTLKYGGRRVSDFVHKHFVRTDGAPRSDAVAVLKTAGGATSQGVLCPDRTAAILRRHNATLVDPAAGEIALINALARARVFVASWGSAFFKNYVYIGDKCTDVYVYHTNDFSPQLDNLGHRPVRFRNAMFHYTAAEDLPFERTRDLNGTIFGGP